MELRKAKYVDKCKIIFSFKKFSLKAVNSLKQK